MTTIQYVPLVITGFGLLGGVWAVLTVVDRNDRFLSFIFGAGLGAVAGAIVAICMVVYDLVASYVL